MRRFITTIKNSTGRAFISETNYLTKMSNAHAHNTYLDDDKAIAQSLEEQKNKIKINLENEWLSAKSEAHAFAGLQDEDKAITKSINEKTQPEHSNTGC